MKLKVEDSVLSNEANNNNSETNEVNVAVSTSLSNVGNMGELVVEYNDESLIKEETVESIDADTAMDSSVEFIMDSNSNSLTLE